MSDKMSCVVDVEGGHVIASITFVPEISEPEIHLLEFEREVADQALREKIREETADIRRLILAHTFSKTGLAE